MKVICTDPCSIKNPEFTGPSPKKRDVLTVFYEGLIYGVYSYQFVEYGNKYAYSACRFEPIDTGIDECKLVNEKV